MSLHCSTCLTGDGAVAGNKSYTTIASRVVAGMAVTALNAFTATTYYFECANTSGVTIVVTKTVTYLS